MKEAVSTFLYVDIIPNIHNLIRKTPLKATRRTLVVYNADRLIVKKL
jgi:hypothetical protein